MAHHYRQYSNKSAKLSSLKLRERVAGKILVLFRILFPLIGKKVLLKLFFTPKRYPLSHDQQAYLDTGRAFNLKVNEDIVKCWTWGEGPAIVFVHGWNGMGLQFKGFIARAIASGFSVILFDGPGHGLSSGETSSYFQMTDVVRALLNQGDHFSVAGLIGHSFGSAAIINSLSKEAIRLPAVLIAPALQLQELIDTAFAQYGIPKRIYMELIYGFEKKYGYSFIKDNPVNLLDNESQEFLIVHDRKDGVIPYEESKKTVKHFPAFELMATRNLGHKKILKDDDVIKASLEFIKKN